MDMNSTTITIGTETQVRIPCGERGWICPQCGRGVNPDVATCPCGPRRQDYQFDWTPPFITTCGTYP